jgi:hypothetical protein
VPDPLRLSGRVTLTAKSRETLDTIRRQPARRIHEPGPGSPPWPHHPSTLAALLRHELVDHVVDRDRRGYWRETWTINDVGRTALEPVELTGRDVPRFLARDVWRHGDYTTEQHDAADELETVDAPPITRTSRAKHEHAKPSAAAAAALNRQARAA